MLAYLVKELFACGAGLDGKLQLCIHSRDTHIVLQNTTVYSQIQHNYSQIQHYSLTQHYSQIYNYSLT